MSEDFDAWFEGDSCPSASFRGEPPIEWGGEIIALAKKQANEYDPSQPNNKGKPKVWPDGNPVMNGWITLQTSVRDPDREDDDGRRVLVLDSRNKREAVKKATGGKAPKLGGYLWMAFTGRDPNGKNPDNLPKLYESRYTPPTTQPQEEDPWAGVNAAPAAAASPAPAAVASTPPAPGVDPGLIAFLMSKQIANAATLDAATAKQIAALYPDNPFK